MCVTSHHFPYWQANRPATPNVKNILFTTCFFIQFGVFFKPSKACDGHAGRLCDTDGWVRASFPWVKYQASVRPVNSYTHNHTNTHTVCWEASRYVFFSFVSFSFECQMASVAHVRKENICIHVWHYRRTPLFSQCQVVYCLAGQGPAANTEKWQHLVPVRVILFSVGTIYNGREESFLLPVLFFFIHFDSQTFFQSCLVYHGCLICDYSDLKPFTGALGCRAHVISYIYLNDLSSQLTWCGC